METPTNDTVTISRDYYERLRAGLEEYVRLDRLGLVGYDKHQPEVPDARCDAIAPVSTHLNSPLGTNTEDVGEPTQDITEQYYDSGRAYLVSTRQDLAPKPKSFKRCLVYCGDRCDCGANDVD